MQQQLLPLLLLTSALGAAPAQVAPPNVLLLVSDSLDGRLLDASSVEWPKVALPELRALAARGAGFAAAYTNSPVCGPSRAAALTSRLPHETGVVNNYQELPRDTFTGGLDAGCLASYGAAQCAAWASRFPINATLFNAFEAAGYDMAVFGKIDIGAGTAQRYPNSTGGSDHGGPEPRCVLRAADLPLDTMGRPSSRADNDAGPSPDDAALAADAAAWLAARGNAPSPRPFFLQMSIGVPHFPFVTGPRWLASVNDSAVELPEWPPLAQLHPYDRHMVFSKGCAGNFSDAEVLQLRRVYLGMAAQADFLHGQVLAALRAAGLEQSTLVVFWSDHGEMAFDLQQVYKNSWREASARVPLIFAGPGVPPGVVVPAPVSLLDLWPTIAALTGVANAPGARGHNLVPLMQQQQRRQLSPPLLPPPAAAPAAPVVGAYFAENSNTGAFFVRQDELKLITYGHAFPWFPSDLYVPQLYNLTADAHEKHNLAPSRPDLVAALQALLTAELGDIEAFDAEVKANDQLVFREYLTKGMNESAVRRMLAANFAGFNESWWDRVVLWNSTSPVPGTPFASSADPPLVSLTLNASNVNSLQEYRVVHSGVNSPWLVVLGAAGSLEDCGALCVAWRGTGTQARCTGFTRFAAPQANGSNCFGNTDGAWMPLPAPQGGVDCGEVAWPCDGDDAACSLNGVCGADGACACDAGWTGRRCGTLDLAPVDRAQLGFNPEEDGRNMSSWGGSVVAHGGAWHMYASRLDNHCGISSYLVNSRIVHAVSSSGPLGPFAEADSVLPPFAHEPCVALAPTGELVLISVHGPLNGFPECVCVDGQTCCGCNACNNSCHPAQPVLSVATDPNGPWQSVQIPPPVGPNSTEGHQENPAIWIGSSGELWGMARGGNMAAYAKDWRNFSTWTRTFPAPTNFSGSHDTEDPILWQDARDNFHCLLHLLEGPHYCTNTFCLVGVHGFSRDGLAWTFGGVAYTNSVTFTDGTSLLLTRRERPHVVFAEGSRRIVALSNSAMVGGGQFGDRSFTLVQGVRGGGGARGF